MMIKLNLARGGCSAGLFAALCFMADPQPSTALAATTIDPANNYAYGANVGWIDWRGDTNSGAVIGEYVCSGYLYSANCGWINLGSGAPANGIQYQNNAAADFGVNQDGLGNLRGYAWGANIGWINFENTGAPKVDLVTGVITGYVWSANCGWISLSNVVAFVQTDTIAPGLDSNSDGIPDAWELLNFGTIDIDPNADPDHDGLSNREEYLGGTGPNNPLDYLRITSESFGPGGTTANLTWTSVLTRQYYILRTPNLESPWTDSGLGLISPDGASTTRAFGDSAAPTRFYRVRAVRPLAP
jgi:hypothetical protein